MSKTLFRLGLIALVAIGLLAPTAAYAVEGPPSTTIEGSDEPTAELPHGRFAAKQVCINAINMRLRALHRADRAIDRSRTVTDEHAATLTRIVDTTRTSLKELRAEIKDATDRETVAVLCEQIVTEHYVFRLVMPQVRLTLNADRHVAVAERLEGVGERVQAKIAELEEAGVDTGDAGATVEAALESLADAKATAQRASGPVLALTVEDVPGGGADEVLQATAGALGEVRGELREAGGALKRVILLLRSLD